jgi:hypothetical protein
LWLEVVVLAVEMLVGVVVLVVLEQEQEHL